MSVTDEINRVRVELGDTAATYLRNKLTGGKSNENGSRYESNFAVFKLSQCIKELQLNQNRDIELFSQAPSFVDDFVVKDNDLSRKQSFQLKNSPNISWKGGRNPIALDFQYCHRMDKEEGVEDSETILTVSDHDLHARLSSTIPDEIAHHTSCEHFEDYISSNKALIDNHAIKDALSQICCINEIDKLCHMHSIIKGIWEDHKNEGCSVKDFVQKVIEVKPEYLRSFAPPFVLESRAAVILNNIVGFSYRILDKVLNYAYSSDSGNTINGTLHLDNDSKLEEFAQKVIQNNPSSFEELWSLGVLGDL
ncbi:hypothetical protein MHM99_01740 [Alteromonas sp. MmMcT2-2]|uniref:hypothetical protein n=1 Tax=Alteromonas sp. MmMcT2-2 TaxID=2917732 RepID=UPI001EF256D0|nr:hypothetical protein [Alteromonas sp. MmMcT2-2]MCG7640239.1 hypothetical protein [Alteromonas sp. MmMcT2-2]|tara:strand:- start:1158 stop:2081 length:924 start_codon:yes stop_codon:yes gene_type:complete